MQPPEAPDKKAEYGAADIHIHSMVSDGMADVPEILEFVARRGDLDVIAITDHDKIDGSYQARELAAERGYSFEVVIGTEVGSTAGHLLALFVEELIPAKRSVAYTVAAIHAQGGLCIVPHPMSMLSESLDHKDIAAIINSSEPDLYFDGIETINATIVGAISNRRAKKINLKYKLAETGSSDAHFLMTVGSALTRFPGRTADDLKRGILEGTTHAQNGTNVSLRKIGMRQIIKQQRKSGGFFVRGAFKNMTKWLP